MIPYVTLCLSTTARSMHHAGVDGLVFQAPPAIEVTRAALALPGDNHALNEIQYLLDRPILAFLMRVAHLAPMGGTFFFDRRWDRA